MAVGPFSDVCDYQIAILSIFLVFRVCTRDWPLDLTGGLLGDRHLYRDRMEPQFISEEQSRPVKPLLISGFRSAMITGLSLSLLLQETTLPF
ncbi:Na+-transporting NADH:ubiquinone oxidoreductase subunit 2 [[Synechococcus] sp. NIES-970]|nr:Na+-transporting NADH:ubiquinone oxidoreductase subunit 2 [[Synechococcus] sp. NIES-970]